MINKLEKNYGERAMDAMTDTPKAGGGAELLPCPFCGADAESHPDNDEWVRCSNYACDAMQSGVSYGGSAKPAVEVWNTRAPSPAPLATGGEVDGRGDKAVKS